MPNVNIYKCHPKHYVITYFKKIKIMSFSNWHCDMYNAYLALKWDPCLLGAVVISVLAKNHLLQCELIKKND